MTDQERIEAFLTDISDLGHPQVPRITRTDNRRVQVTLREEHRDMITVYAALHDLRIASKNRGTGTIACGGTIVELTTEHRLHDTARAYALALMIAYNASVTWPMRGTLESYSDGAGRSVRILLGRGRFAAPIDNPTPEIQELAELLTAHVPELLMSNLAEEDVARILTTNCRHLIERAASI